MSDFDDSYIDSPVLGLPGVTLNIQELINYLRGFQFLSNQEKQCHHASYLQHNNKKFIQNHQFIQIQQLEINTIYCQVSVFLYLMVKEGQPFDFKYEDVILVCAGDVLRLHRLD